MSQQINLFNPVFLKQRKIFTSAAMAQALGVLVIGIAVLAWYTQRSGAELEAQAAQLTRQLEGRQASLLAATAKLAPRKKSVELEARITYLDLQLQALREAGAVIERGRIGNTEGYAGYFRAFARQDSPGLWLTGLAIEGAGVDINIEGRALDAGLVPGYIGKLSAESVLRGKTFGSLRITTPAAAPEAQAAAARPAADAVAPYVEFQLRAAPEKGGRMKQFWFRFSTRLDALSLRERVMVFAAVLSSVVFIAYMMVLSPMFARQEALAKAIAGQQASIAQVEAQIAATATAAGFDPDASNKLRHAALQAEVQQLGTELRSMQESLVQPERIVPLLEAMLRSNGKLRLVSLHTLPVTGLSEPLPTGVETTAPAPASSRSTLSYEAIAAEMEKASKASVPGAAAPPPPPEFKPPELVYRHGVQLTLEGRYVDMVSYMAQLESMPVRLIWGNAKLDASDYPRTRLTLTLFTLSLEKDWMKL